MSRLGAYLTIPEVKRTVSVGTLVRFIIEDCNLNILHRLGLTMVCGTDGERVPIPLEYAVAMQMSERLRLRALDLLHVAYAHLVKEDVEALVTGDEELLEARKKILEVAKVEVRSIEELQVD